MRLMTLFFANSAGGTRKTARTMILGKKEGRGLPLNRAPFSFLLYLLPQSPFAGEMFEIEYGVDNDPDAGVCKRKKTKN